MRYLPVNIIGPILVALFVIFGCSSDEVKKQTFYDEGKKLYEAGKYREALIELKNATKLDPDFVEAYQLIVDTSMRVGDAREAFKSLSRIEKLRPNDLNSKVKLATFYLLGKQIEESQKRIDTVLKKDPNHVEGLLVQAGLHEQAGKIGEAEAALEKVISVDSSQVRAYLGIARLKAIQKKERESEKYLVKAKDADPKNLQTRLALYSHYAKTKQFQKAEKEIKGAIEVKPDEQQLYLLLGNFYAIMKKAGEAEKAFRKAISVSPDKIKGYLTLAGFFDSIGKKTEAVDTYKNALDKQPDNIQALTTIAAYYLKNRDFEKTEQYLKRALEIRPKFFQALMIKGELAIKRRQFDEAAELYDRLVQEEMKSPIVYYMRALAHIGKGETGIAKNDLLKAIELDPGMVKARTMLASQYINEAKSDLAIEQCDLILKQNSKDFKGRILKSEALALKGKYSDAENILKALAKEHPTEPSAYYRLGQIYQVRQDYKKANKYFDSALKINPKLIDVFTSSVFLNVALKQYDKGLSRCEDQLSLYKDTPLMQAAVHFLKGSIYLLKKDTKKAEYAFEKTLEGNPHHLKAYEALANIYLAEGKADDAINKYKQSLEKNPRQPNLLMTLGTIYETKGDLEKSETYYRDALKINPDYAPASNNLAYLISEKEDGNLDEALSYAQSAKEKMPNNPAVMDTLGWIYYRKGLYEMARAELSQSVKKMDGNPLVHFHMGSLMVKMNKIDEAKYHLNRALEAKGPFSKKSEAKKLLETL